MIIDCFAEDRIFIDRAQEPGSATKADAEVTAIIRMPKDNLAVVERHISWID
jgi:hypothetical protein